MPVIWSRTGTRTAGFHWATRDTNGSARREVGEDESYEIVVEDNGIGFKQEYAERIFTVFRHLHGRGEYEGTDVGLAVCRKIVEHHGGRIRAESAPGEGARLIVTLPAKQTLGESRDSGAIELAPEGPDLGQRGAA